MKRFTSIFLIVFSLSVFQNGCVSACARCRTEHTTLNSSVTKPKTDKPGSFIVELPKTIAVKIIKTDHRSDNGFLGSIRTIEDLVKFCSHNTLADLSPEENETIVLLITTWYGSMTVPVPPVVAGILVSVFAHSPKLFSAVPRPCLYSALSLMTANQCALCAASTKDTALFLNGFLSLSPGALHGVPRSSFVSVLGCAVSSADTLNGLPHAPAANLITALSLSKPSFNCLPASTVLALLRYAGSKAPGELMMTLPPSTVFGFLDGLLDTLDSSSSFLANAVPAPVLVGVLGPVMTSRMLSVMPVGIFDLLLSVVGSSHALPRALPVSNLVSVFNILITSPKILCSLSPDSVAKILSTVAACPTILDGIPPSLMHQLLDSINVYSPSTLRRVSANELSMLVGK